MPSRPNIFSKNEPSVLSFAVQARMADSAQEEPDQFRLLVRHLLERFFNNEMMSVGGEPLPLLMTIACVVAIPTLIVAIFQFFAYHAFPPRPPVPSFWHQVSDHYFYVMYAWVVMGSITVFEWDMLFPNLLDVFILSSLPIENRRLLQARIVAVLIFLGLFLMVTSSLGIVFFPLITELPHIGRFYTAHFAAVMICGICASAQFLALQGVLLSILGARIFRMVSTFLQSFSMTILLVVLFLFPLVSNSLEALIRSDIPVVRSFPPFWFLGIYESILAGHSSLPVFDRLAHTGYWVTALMVLLSIVTYPLAYRRMIRQVIEGSGVRDTRRWLYRAIAGLMHATVLRTPSRRAVFHFISQTLLRTQRHRVYLAMYAGLGIALVIAAVLVFRVEPDHLGITFSSYGLRLAVPAIAFWTIAGLSTALASPADPGGGWVFRVIHGCPGANHLAAARMWVTFWGLAITLGAVTLLHVVAPTQLRGTQVTAGQIVVAVGLCLLLTDVFFLKARDIPFTESRIPLNTDLAFVLLRYIVFFPMLVLITVDKELWIEASAAHLMAATLMIIAAHVAMCLIHQRLMMKSADRAGFEEEEIFLQLLSLRD